MIWLFLHLKLLLGKTQLSISPIINERRVWCLLSDWPPTKWDHYLQLRLRHVRVFKSAVHQLTERLSATFMANVRFMFMCLCFLEKMNT